MEDTRNLNIPLKTAWKVDVEHISHDSLWQENAALPISIDSITGLIAIVMCWNLTSSKIILYLV